jgi:hypothetical protein
MRAERLPLGTIIVALSIGYGPVHAAEIWSCEYTGFRSPAKEWSQFRVEGNHLVEVSGDALTDYQILENSKTAIVAAKGGSYSSEPTVMSFLVMIKKETGAFALITASLGSLNSRQDGLCRPDEHRE